MKHLFLFFLAVIFFGITNAQAPAIQWKKTFGSSYTEIATSTQQTTDGGYIVAGYANWNSGDVTGNNGGSDFWVVKLSAAGAIQWQKCYGGSRDDMAYCIQQTSDGGYIMAGSTVSIDGQVTGLHPSQGNPLWGDYWVVKIDNSGTLQWQKTLGGTGFDIARSITQTADGGYVVLGETNSGDGDFVNGGNIIKLSSTGAIKWNSYQGGVYNYSVKPTSDGGYIVAGTILNQFSVLKLDSLGVHQWWKFYGGSGWDVANSALQTKDGGYIVAGYTQSNDGDVTGFHGGIADAWLLKLDSLGELQWQKTLGGTYDDEANYIKQTTDGGYIIACVSNSNDGDVSGLHGTAGASDNGGAVTDYWVVKTNSSGNIQWQKSMGSSYIEKASCIQQTTDGGYIVAGSTVNHVVNDGDVTGFHVETTNPNVSGYDYWVVKLAPQTVTSVKDITRNNTITIFPNPASNSIYINGLTNKTNTIQLINALGIVITNWTNTPAKEFDISHLSDGIYFLVVENNYYKIIKK
ncbi:MAG: T9SS type A sorting domain-containing protein [Bacteroidetes bacterium]|nr:T9SS type A sorting domain-containing protein [Bacteroidota bacterium]